MVTSTMEEERNRHGTVVGWLLVECINKMWN